MDFEKVVVLAMLSFVAFSVFYTCSSHVEINLPSEVIENDDFSLCSNMHIEKRFGSLIVNCKEAK